MKKQIGALLLVVIMATTLLGTSVSAAGVAGVDKNEITASQISAITEVRVNGVRLDESEHWGYFWIDAAGRTQAPVRLLVENMGYSITYNNGVVTVPGGPNGDLVITIGDKNLKVGGSTVAMDTMAVTISGRTYVPLRFVAEALGATVSTEKWPDIDIATTFTPERTINGVANMSWDKCVNVQKFIEENKSDIYWPTSDRLRLSYLGPRGNENILDIIHMSNSYQVMGLEIGDNAERQYELINALIDDVVEEGSRQLIKDKIVERETQLTNGYDPSVGISAEAKVWRDAHSNESIRIGNVQLTWNSTLKQFTISRASN